MQPAQPIPARQTPSQPIPQNAHYKNQIDNYNYQNNYPFRKTISMQGMPTNSMASFGMIPMQTSQSIQSIESSENQRLSQQSSQNFDQSQTFPVFYDNVQFMVNPISLYKASLKFQQLVQPFLNNNNSNNQQFSELQLEVLGNEFTIRNMNNFLRLCQNLSADVQDSEMKEICEISKLFQAEQIYNTGVAFVRRQIDPKFNVPDEKYDGSDGKTYLMIDGETNLIHHANLSDLDFASNDTNSNHNQTSYQSIQTTTENAQSSIGNVQSNYQNAQSSSDNVQSNYQNAQSSSDNVQSNYQNAQSSSDNVQSNYQNAQSSSDNVQSNHENVQSIALGNQLNTENKDALNDENRPNNTEHSASDANKANKVDQSPDSHKSVIYTVRVEGHFFKCPVYRFCANNHVIYTAKQKDCDVYIGEGNEVHISKMRDKHVAHIFQCDSYHNLIRLKDFQFRLQYVNSGKPGHLSIDVGFPLGDKDIRWTPKTPKYDMETNKYYLNFAGEYHHEPIKSRKNIVLQNLKGNPTFIVRKVKQHVYEIECLPIVDPLIVFTIGLSDIIGPSPYYDYLG